MKLSFSQFSFFSSVFLCLKSAWLVF